MITSLRKLKCCCTSLYRADAVRYGMMMMMLVVGLLFTAQPAAAQTSGTNACIKEKTGLNNPSCTANDVRIGKLEVAPGGPATCNSGDEITLNLIATIESGPARYDIGIWVNTEGNSARSDPSGNNCYRDYLPPPLSSTACEPNGNPYFDADGDTCGDLNAVGTNPCGTAVTGACTEGGGTCLFTTRTFTITVVCNDSNGDGIADLGTCTSWDNNTTGACSTALQTDPGTGSKCNCGPTNILNLHIGCVQDSDCTDHDACSTGKCQDNGTTGTCVYTAISCDDTNECTTDTCDGTTGCVHTPISCDDSNACTDDSCVPATGCVNANNTDPCNDGNACTTNDACSGGTCVGGGPPNCNDGNPCTDDSCNPASGCVNANNSAPCDDGNICTTNDACSGGSCVGGAPLDCNDHNDCTTDSCDPAVSGGCVNSGSCETDTQIAPTATTCSDYNSGQADNLDFLLYGTRGGAINSVSPGVFFLYDGEHNVPANGTITVTETNSVPWTGTDSVILPRTGQVILYDTSCNKLNVGHVEIDPATGNVTITNVPAGTYILGIKYDSTTLKGFVPDGDPNTIYTFTVMVGAVNSGSDTIAVNPKP